MAIEIEQILVNNYLIKAETAEGANGKEYILADVFGAYVDNITGCIEKGRYAGRYFVFDSIEDGYLRRYLFDNHKTIISEAEKAFKARMVKEKIEFIEITRKCAEELAETNPERAKRKRERAQKAEESLKQ